MKAKDMEGYNGPSKEDFLETLADYEEVRFFIAQANSKAGKILGSWEKAGGDKDDLRDGYKLRLMDTSDQQRELRRQFRVAGWIGVIDEDRTGQASFLKVFDVKAPELGIGGAAIGSRLSIVRAKSAGFNDGKAKNGPAMQEGIEAYDWTPDSDEAMAYAEGFGKGLELRPPPKVKKGDDIDAEPQDEPGPSALDTMTEKVKELDAAEDEAKKPRLVGNRGKRQQPAEPLPEEPPKNLKVDDIWSNGPGLPRTVN